MATTTEIGGGGGFALIQHMKLHTDLAFEASLNSLPSYLFFPGLMGLLEKRRYQKFLIFCNDYEESDPKTHQGTLRVRDCVFTVYNLNFLNLRKLMMAYELSM